MEPIQVFKKTEDGTHLEFTVIIGHESRDVGFLVKMEKRDWEDFAKRYSTPEHLIKKSFEFLLKKGSKYSVGRSFDLRDIQKKFPEYLETIGGR